jgi:hypothetical protein
MRRLFVATCLAVLALALSGCDSGPKMYDVQGEVTLDGHPVPAGDIRFLPEETRFGPDAGKFKDGKYLIKAREGRKRVEIWATREVPGKKGPMGEPLLEDIVPAKYNIKTTLTIDVGPGKTTHDFPLKSR